MICHQLGHNELGLGGPRGSPGEQGLSRTPGAPLQQPGPDAGASSVQSPKEIFWPQVPTSLARPAKLLMSGNGHSLT